MKGDLYDQPTIQCTNSERPNIMVETGALREECTPDDAVMANHTACIPQPLKRKGLLLTKDMYIDQ